MIKCRDDEAIKSWVVNKIKQMGVLKLIESTQNVHFPYNTYKHECTFCGKIIDSHFIDELECSHCKSTKKWFMREFEITEGDLV